MTRKPGASFTTTAIFPSRRAKAVTFMIVSSDVSLPLITSTRGMRSTGLKKCSPATRDGPDTDPPISLMDRDEVLDSMSAVSGSCPASEENTDFFTSMRSATASMARSYPPRPRICVSVRNLALVHSA